MSDRKKKTVKKKVDKYSSYFIDKVNVNCLKKDLKRITKRYTHITLRGKTCRQALGKK